MRHLCLLLWGSALLLTAEKAAAQSSVNVATVAVDAFGKTVGSEQIGLYNEQQVRGFSLQDSGNYRLDGAYFIRSAIFAVPAVQEVLIRVGVNALGVDFPAPSGIVEYRIPTAAPGKPTQIEAGVRDYGGWPVVLVRSSAATDDGVLGASYGFDFLNETMSDGVKKRSRHAAFVPVWQPSDVFMAKAFVTYDGLRKPGNWSTAASGNVLPPKQHHPGDFPANWSKFSQDQYNWGAIVRYTPSPTFSLQSSLVFSDWDRTRADFTLLSLGASGTGLANGTRSRPFDVLSSAAETKASWQVTDQQRVYGTIRLRHTESHVRPGVSVPLGFVDQLIGTPDTPEPADPPDITPTTERIKQVMAGIGYERYFGPSVFLRGAVLKTRYTHDVEPPNGATRTNTDSPWLYDFAASYAATDRLTFFATTVRGLEESGAAPTNAANSDEILPAVRSTQYELGARYRFFANFTFISSLFQISKPTPGLDTQNVYRLITQARHRGLELSLSGRPVEHFNLVAGVALLDPARRGELVDRGLIVGRAVGVPSVTGLLNLTYELPMLANTSLDGQLNYTSRRLLNSRTGLYTPGYGTLDVGARYGFQVRGTHAVLRVRITNLFDKNQWIASRSETLDRTPRRGFRATVTAEF